MNHYRRAEYVAHRLDMLTGERQPTFLSPLSRCTMTLVRGDDVWHIRKIAEIANFDEGRKLNRWAFP